MKKFLKKISPNFIFNIYYYLLAISGSFIYGFPSNKMVVIGVVGTKGKTSTINFIWSALMAGGVKTGIISTANIRIGDTGVLNKYHMTMPGRLTIQSLLSQMVKANCKYCIVETTSEGIKQYRNIGINYDTLVFTNLTPEHLPSHDNSFLKYKETKGKIFASLTSEKSKTIDGKAIPKIIIANKDSEHADYFLNFNAEKKISYAIDNDADYKASNIVCGSTSVDFDVSKEKYTLEILGTFNVYNALPALAIAHLAGINNNLIKKGFINLKTIPGRMELINAGQNFTVIVDYAHEKVSITNLLQTANIIRKEGKKIIIIIGAEGGGRDKAKRPIMGELSAKMADYVIVTDVDPYDDNPKEILEDIAVSAEKFGKIKEQNLFVIEDRREGIKKALKLANEGDIVLVTGKGAEQSMIKYGKAIPWDDRTIVKEELAKL